MTDKNFQAGHRERLRQRYESGGIDAFADYEVLELLLTYAIPRSDTKPAAHELVERYGSLEDALAAPRQELERVEGIGPNSAFLLSFIGDITRRCELAKGQKKLRVLSNPDAVAAYAVALMRNEKAEAVYCIMLDSHFRLIRHETLARGDAQSAQIVPRDIVELVLRYGAAYVVLLHNHPGGSLEPSAADILATQTIATLLNQIGVRLLDHYIVAQDRIVGILNERVFDADEPECAAAESNDLSDQEKLAQLRALTRRRRL